MSKIPTDGQSTRRAWAQRCDGTLPDETGGGLFIWRRNVLSMNRGDIDTVIWLGAGASYGSQRGKIGNPPPVTPTFFDDPLVQQMMPDYPVLQHLWRTFGQPTDLERFWQALDDGCNSPSFLPACDVNELEAQLRDSASLSDADEPRKQYYQANLRLLRCHATKERRYVQAVFVAGWELKHLLIHLLDRHDYDLGLHENLFGTVQRGFGILTFNYDTIAEQALERTGHGFTYDLAGKEAILVSKPHGSIQWEWRKHDDRPEDCERVATLRAGSPYGLVTDQGFFRDPLFIGLRTKRELTGNDPSDSINRFWNDRLFEARLILAAARRIVVVGFAFQDADTYLWKRLSADQIGRDKRVLICDFKMDDVAREEMMNKVKKFFATDYVTAHWDGLSAQFITVLEGWMGKP